MAHRHGKRGKIGLHIGQQFVLPGQAGFRHSNALLRGTKLRQVLHMAEARGVELVIGSHCLQEHSGAFAIKCRAMRRPSSVAPVANTSGLTIIDGPCSRTNGLDASRLLPQLRCQRTTLFAMICSTLLESDRLRPPCFELARLRQGNRAQRVAIARPRRQGVVQGKVTPRNLGQGALGDPQARLVVAAPPCGECRVNIVERRTVHGLAAAVCLRFHSGSFKTVTRLLEFTPCRVEPGIDAGPRFDQVSQRADQGSGKQQAFRGGVTVLPELPQDCTHYGLIFHDGGLSPGQVGLRRREPRQPFVQRRDRWTLQQKIVVGD